LKKIIPFILLFVFVSSAVYPAEEKKIVVIKSRGGIPYDMAFGGFKEHLARAEVEVQIMEYSIEGKSEDERLKLTEEIISKNPDLILTLGTPATLFAQEHIKEVCSIFTMVLDPTASRILLPGVSMDIPSRLMLEGLRKNFPDIRRIGLIYTPDTVHLYKEIARVSDEWGFQLIAKEITSPGEFPDAFKSVCEKADCFLMIPDPEIYFPTSVEYLLLESLRMKVPVVGLSASYTKAGALVSFECDYQYLGKQAGELALKVFAGGERFPMKIEKPRKINFSLNLLVAERLNIKIPSRTTKEASEVFEK